MTWTGEEIVVVNDPGMQPVEFFRYEADGTYIGEWIGNASNSDPLGVTWAESSLLVVDSDNAVYRYAYFVTAGTSAQTAQYQPYSLGAVTPTGTTLADDAPIGTGSWEVSNVSGFREVREDIGSHTQAPYYTGFQAGVYRITYQQFAGSHFAVCVSKATSAPASDANLEAAASQFHQQDDDDDGADFVLYEVLAANEYLWARNCEGSSQTGIQSMLAIEGLGF